MQEAEAHLPLLFLTFNFFYTARWVVVHPSIYLVKCNKNYCTLKRGRNKYYFFYYYWRGFFSTLVVSMLVCKSEILNPFNKLWFRGWDPNHPFQYVRTCFITVFCHWWDVTNAYAILYSYGGSWAGISFITTLWLKLKLMIRVLKGYLCVMSQKKHRQCPYQK